MARISNTTVYPVDSNIDATDRLLGTDAGSNSSLATRSYTISDLNEYFSNGTNLLTSVPPQYVPVIHEHSVGNNRVEIGPLRVDKNGVMAEIVPFTLTSAVGGNVTEISLRVNNSTTYLVIDNPTLDVDFKSLEGVGFTGTFMGEVVTGTINTFPSTQIPNSVTTDWVIDPDGNTEWWFDVTTDVNVTGDWLGSGDIVFNTGNYERLVITYIGEATFINNVSTDGTLSADGNISTRGDISGDGSLTIIGAGSVGEDLTVVGDVSGQNAVFTDVEADTASIGAAEIDADGVTVTGTLTLIPPGGGNAIPIPQVEFLNAAGLPENPARLNADGDLNFRDTASVGRTLGIDWTYDANSGDFTGTTALPNIGITDVITVTAEADDNTEGEALEFLYNNLHMDANGVNHPWHVGDMAVVTYTEDEEIDEIRDFVTADETNQRTENVTQIRFDTAAQATRVAGLLDPNGDGAVDALVAGTTQEFLFGTTSIVIPEGTEFTRDTETIEFDANSLFAGVTSGEDAPGQAVQIHTDFAFTDFIVLNGDNSITVTFDSEDQALEFQRLFGTGPTNMLSTVASSIDIGANNYVIPAGTQFEHAAGSNDVQVHATVFAGVSTTATSLTVLDIVTLGTEITVGSNMAIANTTTEFTLVNVGSLAARNSLLSLFRTGLDSGPSFARNVALRFGPTLTIDTTQLAALTPAITLVDGTEYAVMVETDPQQPGVDDVIRFTFQTGTTEYELGLRDTANAANVAVTFLDIPNNGSRLLVAGAGYDYVNPFVVNIPMGTTVQPGTDDVVEIAQEFNLPTAHAASGIPIRASGVNEAPRTINLTLLYSGTDQGATAANTVANDWVNITPSRTPDASLQGVTVLNRIAGTAPAIVPPATTSEVVLSTNRLYIVNDVNLVLRLPAQPVAGDQVLIGNTSGSSTSTIVPNNASQRIQGSTDPVELDDPNASFHLIFSGDANVGWAFVGMQSYTRLGANEAVPPAPGTGEATVTNRQTVFAGQTIIIPANRTEGYFYAMQDDPDSGDVITVINRSGATGIVGDPFPDFQSFAGATNVDNILFEPVGTAAATDELLIDTPDTFQLTFNGNNNQWIIS